MTIQVDPGRLTVTSRTHPLLQAVGPLVSRIGATVVAPSDICDRGTSR